MPKKYILPVREVDRAVYDLIKSGRKKLETRAGGPRYQHIKKGDTVVLKCGKDSFEKTVTKVHKFKSVKEMLKRHKPSEIDPRFQSAEELIALYHSFPNYDERLKKYGVIAFELKNRPTLR